MEKDKREEEEEEREDPLECPSDLGSLYECEEEELECIRNNWKNIRSHTVTQRHLDIYHVRMTEKMNIQNMMNGIFNEQTIAFKVNFAFGFVLRNSQTDELRYYYPSQNRYVFDKPVLVRNQEELQAFIEKIGQTDWLEYIRQQKPNSQWRISVVCCLAIYIYRIPQLPIGRGGDDILPSYLKENRGLDGMERNRQTGKLYEDHLCYFRCLARHKGFEVKNLEKKTKTLYVEYLKTLSEEERAEFKGVTLDNLPRLDQLFGIQTFVYALEQRGRGHPIATLVHRPMKNLTKKESEEALKLNLFKGHFSYIKNMRKYSKAYECQRCGKAFPKDYKLSRHERGCEAKVKYTYPGGVYTPSKTVFDKLEEEGIQVGEDLKFSKYFATYDIEVYYPNSADLPPKRPKLEFTAEHKLLSISVASNIPDFESPRCFIVQGEGEEEAEQLVGDFVTYLHDISDRAYALEQTRYADLKRVILETLTSDPTVTTPQQPREHQHHEEEEDVGYDDDSDSKEEEEEEEENEEDGQFIDDESVQEEADISFYRHVNMAMDVKASSPSTSTTSIPSKAPPKPFKRQSLANKLVGELDQHLRPLPVIGFNSGSYDLNVLKQFIIPYLVRYDNLKSSIKRHQSYLTLMSTKLTFLDVSNFLAAGSNYDGFLRAYGCVQQKGFFPYEWVNSLEKLDHPQLPPHEAFHSKLKDSDISQEEYQYCEQVWQDQGMKTFRDFLQWYNNLDVPPFVEAVEKMKTFWRERQINMTDHISLPGLAMQFEMSFLREENLHLSVFDTAQLYHLFKENMVGGPAIIFKRYAEAGKTLIRGNPNKTCENIVGYDANALYLWALSQEMPVGLYTHWQSAGPYKFQSKVPIKEVDEWLAWVAHQHQVTLRTRLNNSEKRLGDRQLPMDGFDPNSNTPYQYMGCYWHGCPTCFDPARRHPTRGQTYAYWYEKTMVNVEYLESLGYTPIIQWGCQWKDEKERNPNIEVFLNSHFPGREKKLKLPSQIQEEVKVGDFFGAVEVDIHVPNVLKSRFAEMTPIFKNVDISINDIGNQMREFAKHEGCMPRPRRALIGSYFGEKILLATPLLQFYLDQGLVVTKIHQAVQWVPAPCFRRFGDFVSDARREGDRGGSAIVAETAKTVGNAGYGRFLMDVSRHQDVSYSQVDHKVARTINSFYFQDLAEINEGVYELKTAKKKLVMKLPIQIGFFVYQYAKLRMLQFHYQFLERFLDHSDFELLEMDTDSSYIALAGPSLESLIKPELREEFQMVQNDWLPREDSPQHAAFDKRTPGLFKVEWSGQGFVGLNSETYYCWGQSDKYSCKGISKRNNDITKEKYLKVLQTKKADEGVNKGFRIVNNRVLTYSQFRGGFSYF